MVGSTVKKYAKEKNWQIKNGVAFGIYLGYMMSMQEGSGWKSLSIAARLEDENALHSVYELLNDANTMKNYRISGSTVSPSAINVTFVDSIGSMKKIIAFVDFFAGALDSFGAKGADYCSSCGNELGGMGVPALMNDTVYFLHEGCLNRDDEQFVSAKEEIKKGGSAVSGTVGAFIGAIIGAIPWAVAYYFGWFVAWLGFLIGIAAKKGYELLNGKESRAKGFAIIVATVLGVIIAESAAIMVYLGIAWSQEGYTFGVSDVIYSYFYTLASNSEALLETVWDIVLGLVFAFLGIWSTIKGVFKATGKNADRFIRLDK